MQSVQLILRFTINDPNIFYISKLKHGVLKMKKMITSPNKNLKLNDPNPAGFELESKNSLVYTGKNPCRNGKERRSVATGYHRSGRSLYRWKARKPNKREDFEPSPRGSGTSKDAIIGAVQRGGKVVAQLAPELTGRTILEFIRSVVNLKDSELMTDESRLYSQIGRELKHSVINHQVQFADGDKHTNT